MRYPTPENLLTDEELAQSAAEIEKIPSPLEPTAEIDPNRVRPDPGIFSEFGAGVASARKTLGSQVFGVAGLVAESGVLGEELDTQAGQLMTEAGRYSRMSAEAAPETNEMVEIDGVGDFANYTAGLLGSFLPDVGLMVASGFTSLGARTAAKALTKGVIEKEIALQVANGATKEAAKEAVELAIRKNLQNPETLKSLGRLGNWVAKGGAESLASKAAGYGVMAGTGIARQTADIGNSVYEATGEIDPTTALAGGIPAGLMDAFGDIVVGGKLFGIGAAGKVAAEATEEAAKKGLGSVLKSTGKGVLKGAAVEAPTEALQQAISIAAVKSKTGEAWTSDDYDQLKEAAFGGGILGGLLGGAGGGVEGVAKALESKRYKGLEKTPAQEAREKGTSANVKKADNTIDTLERMEAVDQQGSPTKATQAVLADAAKSSIEGDEDALDSAELQAELKKMAKATSETVTQQELTEQATPATDEKLEAARPKAESKVEGAPPQATIPGIDVTQPKLPQNLSKSNPTYGGFNKNFTLNFESDLDRAAYIVANEKSQSKSHEEFLKFGEANGFTREELVAHGKQVKSNIRSMAQVSQPGELKIANTEHPAKAKAKAPAEAKAIEKELEVPTIDESVKAAEEMVEQAKVEETQPDHTPTTRAMDRGVVEVPVDNIKLSKDVPQFKSGADPKTGVVEPLGKYKRFPERPENPIMLWERNNGDIEVVSGRHRVDSAKTSGEKTIPSQIWREADGYDAAQMAALDAASNIQDGNGTIQDYAQYIRNAYRGLTSEQALAAADSAGLLGRASGRAGFEIGINSSDALYAALLRGDVKGLTTNKAAIIAKAAPLDDDLQRAALKVVAGLTEEAIPGFIAKVSRDMTRSELQLDLFGESDQILVDAVKVAKAAIAKQKSIQEQINLVANNVRKQEESAALGVPVPDIEFTKAKLAQLEAEKERVKNFANDEAVQVELGGTPRRNVEVPATPAASTGSPAAYSEEQRLRVQAENPGMSKSNVRRILEGKSPVTETKREQSRANDRKDLLDIGFGWEVGDEGITVTPDEYNRATAAQRKAWEEEWAAADVQEDIDMGRTIDTVGEDNLFSEGELPFNLQGEEDITPLLQKQADERNAAAEAKRAADEAQGDMFAEVDGVFGPKDTLPGDAVSMADSIRQAKDSSVPTKITDDMSPEEVADVVVKRYMLAFDRALTPKKKEVIVKSKKGVKERGEVFTPEWIANDMINMLPESSFLPETTFLEPAVGEGVFLMGILKRKLDRVTSPAKIIESLASLKGVDIDAENVAKTKANLKQMVEDAFDINFMPIMPDLDATIDTILDGNIVLGDFLNPNGIEFSTYFGIGSGQAGKIVHGLDGNPTFIEVRNGTTGDSISTSDPTEIANILGKSVAPEVGGNVEFATTVLRDALVTDKEGNETLDFSSPKLSGLRASVMGALLRTGKPVSAKDSYSKAVMAKLNEEFGGIPEAIQWFRDTVAEAKKSGTKPLFARTGPAVEIKATPSIGRGKEHFARIKSAVEAVARLYPGRKMRFVEKESDLPKGALSAKRPTPYIVGWGVDKEYKTTEGKFAEYTSGGNRITVELSPKGFSIRNLMTDGKSDADAVQALKDLNANSVDQTGLMLRQDNPSEAEAKLWDTLVSGGSVTKVGDVYRFNAPTRYKFDHQPTARGARLFDLDEENDPGSSSNYDQFGYMDNRDNEAAIIRKVRGNPDAMVTVYRGVPKYVSKIEPGDWVGLDKKYAGQHGGSNTHVISMKVPAKEIRWDGNDIAEFGWFPQDADAKIQYSNAQGKVEAYFDPATNEMVFVTDNIRDEVRAAKLFFHESTHGNVARMELNPEAKAGLDDVLKRSKAALQREVPQILKDGGYASLDEMAADYGYDRNTEEGKRLLQGEIVARFAERIANDPKPPVWWKRMLSDLKLWFKKHFNITMSAKDLEYFLRSEMGSVGNTTGAFEAKVLMSRTQQLQEVTVEDAKRMGVPDLTKAAILIQGMSNRDERFNAMLDIIQDEILRRAIRADRVVGGVVTIDKRWADRVATNPEGTFNIDAFEAALAERVADGNARYVQAGADAEPITAIVDGQIFTESGTTIPINKLILSADKIFTSPAKEPEYLKPGERRGQQDPKNVPATNGSNVDGPTQDRWDKAQYLLHEKFLKPLFGEKPKLEYDEVLKKDVLRGPNQRGGAFGSGNIPKEVRDLINSKNQFIASKVKAVEFRWKAYNDAVKAAWPAGVEGVQKLLNTAQGIIANTIDEDQRRRSEAIGRSQYTLAQARWVQANKPQFMNAIATLDTQSKRNAYLKGKLNAAEYNQMNSQAHTAQNESRKNAIGAFRLDNYNKAKAAKAEALQQLPQEVADALQSMNLAIDELMAYGIEKRLITSRMSAAVGDQPGLYLVRTYHLLDNPDFRAKVKAGKALQAETQRLTEWIHTQLINTEAKNILAANAARMLLDPTEPLLSLKEARIAASVSEATQPDKVLAYVRDLQNVKYEDQAYTVLDSILDTSAKELGLPQEVMDAWGVHTDVGANFAKTMQRVAQDIATTEMMKELLKLGTEQGFLADPKTGAVVPEGFEEIKAIGKYGAMKALEGFYAPPRFIKYFEQYYDPAEVHPLMKLWAKVALATTLTKTVFSVPSLSVNFLSNTAFAIVAGHSMNAVTGGGMMSGVANGWASLAGKSTKERQAYVEKLIRLGVFGNNVGPQMVKEIMLQASRSIDDIDTDLTKSLLNPDYKWYKSLSGLTNKAIDFRGRLYGMADEIWKVNGFEAEIENIKEHEAYLKEQDPDFVKSTQAQIEQRAADYVRDVYPTYDLAPQFVKDMKRVPFLGQFMTFSAAMIRTAKRVTERAVQDIKSGDKFLQHRGYATLGRMAAVIAAPTAVAAMSALACGIDDEEEEALRASLPAWQRNATLIFLGKDDKGNIRYWDTSRVDPYKMLKEPFFAAISALDGDIANAPKAVGSGIATAVKPWLGVDIATGSILEAFYNNKGDGAKVYNPEDPDAWKSVMGHIWKGFEPGDLTMARNLKNGAIGESDMATEIASAFGFRSNVNDPIKSLGFATWKATNRLRDANTLLLRAMHTGENIDGAFEAANAARADIIKPLWTQYQGSIKRGVSEEEADKILKEQRLSKDMIAQIKGGYLLPYKPGNQSMKKAEKASVEQVEGLLKSTERVYFEEQ